MYRFHEFGNCCSCMPLMKLVLRKKWIMLHMVKSIHSKCLLTFTACVDVTCATGIQMSHSFPKHNAEKHFGDYRLLLQVFASASVELLVTHHFK